MSSSWRLETSVITGIAPRFPEGEAEVARALWLPELGTRPGWATGATCAARRWMPPARGRSGGHRLLPQGQQGELPARLPC